LPVVGQTRRFERSALLFGDPTKAGTVVLRFKFPPNRRTRPHRHPYGPRCSDGASFVRGRCATEMVERRNACGDWRTPDGAQQHAAPRQHYLPRCVSLVGFMARPLTCFQRHRRRCIDLWSLLFRPRGCTILMEGFGLGPRRGRDARPEHCRGDCQRPKAGLRR
jgi:hypothetical protein